MPQLFFSVERDLADELARLAADENLPLSQYPARLVREQVQAGWPEGYLAAVIGCCADDPLREPDDGPPDEVDLNRFTRSTRTAFLAEAMRLRCVRPRQARYPTKPLH